MYSQNYIRLISLVQKGGDYLAANKIGGASPRRVQARGTTPRGERPFAIDVEGGEIVTLM